MDLLEHEGKALLAAHGLPVPKGGAAREPQQARRVAAGLGGPVMVKAQLRGGGRGKAGLVRPADDPAEAALVAADLLGTVRPPGQPEVEALLIEERLRISDEFYLAIRIDDVAGAPVVHASTHGGVEVESTARGRTAAHEVDVLSGLGRHHAVALWKEAGLRGRALRQAAAFTTALWRAYRAIDGDLVEINPVVVDDAGRFWAADAKVTISDNALHRQPLLAEQWLAVPATPLEKRARALGINSFVDLEGDVLLYCSGAGFSMCVFDAVARAGLRPANFLDMGGATDRATREKTAELLLTKADREPAVKAILIGTVLTMQLLENTVEAFTAAFTRHPPRVPVVAWFHAGLAATANLSVAEARRHLEQFGIQTCDTVDDAVDLVARHVAAAA